MKRWIAIIMSVVPLAASAASFWDGSAALQRGDSSFESGLYAVSDSFAAETVIEVQNLDTGATARVTVREGVPGQPGILVFLSPKAAEALGIPAGSVTRVRVILAGRAPSGLASLDQDSATNPDPEVSAAPAIAAEAATVEPAPVEMAAVEPAPVEPAPIEPAPVEMAAVEPAPVEPAPIEPAPVEMAAVEPAPIEPAPVEPATVEPATIEPATIEPAPIEPMPVQEPPVEIVQAEPAQVEAPAVEAAPAETPLAETPLSEDEQLLKELAARSPQKQLFLPPREDEKFAYQQPVEPPQPEVEIAAAQPEAEIPAALPEAESTLPSPTPQTLAVPALEQPTAAQPAIESADTARQPAMVGSMPADLAEAQAPPEVTPELSDRIAATVEPDSSRPPRLPVPEPLAFEQKPQAAAAAAPPAEPAAKPETLAALPPQTAAPKTETVPVTVTQPKAQPIQKPTTPVEQKPAVQPARVLPPASKTTPYYVQLAAYSAESLATGLAASLSATYPVVVLAPAQSGTAIYRVLIGPLNKAESGTLLRLFRNRGFPDAFVKQE